MIKEGPVGYFDISGQPDLFPTHEHAPEFWEHLGRVVATFGYLEWAVSRAAFALSATTPIRESDLDSAISNWSASLEKFLTDALGGLIDRFVKALNQHPQPADSEEIELFVQLKEAKKLRDALCHSLWLRPDDQGVSLPLFFNRKKEKLETPINREFLVETQKHVAELGIAVINVVTSRGIAFPGTISRG